MKTKQKVRPGIRGAGRAVLVKALQERKPFHTSGSLRGTDYRMVDSVTFHDLGQLDREESNAFMLDFLAQGVQYVVWSYETPIAWVSNGNVHHVQQRFSVTTSKHQGIVRTYLD